MPSATTPPPPLTRPPDLSSKLPPLLARPRTTTSTTAPAYRPAPPTPPLPSPPPASSLTFSPPVRRILTPADLSLFLASPTHTSLVAFIFNIADTLHNIPISAALAKHKTDPDPTITGLLAILTALDDLITSHPAAENGGSRFGNPAFRAYHAAATSALPSLLTTHLPFLPAGASTEVSTYLSASLGSPARLDYGSGHELSLFAALLVLYLTTHLPLPTLPAIALVLLPAYLHLARALQATYYLEPAGSHGVWGLDDFHFLPFLLGAAQLTTHPSLRPRAIHSLATLDTHAGDWLYLDAVRHLHATKTVAGLRWHSPLLDDISGVRGGWAQVEAGLRRMWLAELLGKLPVMQHFLFGGVLAAPDGCTPAREAEAETCAEGDVGHEHNVDAWGDCCGIRVPSGVGAAEEMRKRGGAGAALRMVPFD